MRTSRALKDFRKKVRKHQDKGLDPKVVGLFLDAYEVFCVIAEEMQKEAIAEEIAASILQGPPPGFGKMFKIPAEEFEKAVKGDKKEVKDKPGAYL